MSLSVKPLTWPETKKIEHPQNRRSNLNRLFSRHSRKSEFCALKYTIRSKQRRVWWHFLNWSALRCRHFITHIPREVWAAFAESTRISTLGKFWLCKTHHLEVTNFNKWCRGWVQRLSLLSEMSLIFFGFVSKVRHRFNFPKNFPYLSPLCMWPRVKEAELH